MSGHRPKKHQRPRDLWETPEGRAWRKERNEELRPKIRDSAVVMTLWPADGEPDAKIAVELGFTLMFGKPLVILKPSGANVPATLVRVADAIVEFDELNQDVMDRVMGEYKRILRERGEPLPEGLDDEEPSL